MYDEEGEHIDGTSESGEMLEYVHGYDTVLPGLERQVAGMVVGEKKTIWVEPSEAFGDYDDEGCFEVEREEFEGISAESVGEVYELVGPDGEVTELLVKEVRETTVLVDANHPLAGVRLRYEVELVSVREATAEELHEAKEGGHDHSMCGPDGHNHGHLH